MTSYLKYKAQMSALDADDDNIETWITVKGNHIPIMKGQSKEEAVKAFIEKKGGSGEKKESAPKTEKPVFRELKGTKHQGGTIGLSAEEHKKVEEYNKWARKEVRRAKSGEAAREANARPILKASEADVSDIVKHHKQEMKALGENPSFAKQKKVEVNAIKEFMRRKVGAGHPYEDYYNYWLRGMNESDSNAFNEIYSESEFRELAFESLSNEKPVAQAEPKSEKRYERPVHISEPLKDNLAEAKAKKDVTYVSEKLKTPEARKLYDRIGDYAKAHSELPLDHKEHLVALRKILLEDNNAVEHVEKNFKKWFGDK